MELALLQQKQERDLERHRTAITALKDELAAARDNAEAAAKEAAEQTSALLKVRLLAVAKSGHS